MASHRNVLILKGSVPWRYLLNLLDALIAQVVTISPLGYTPRPWQIFSLVCASGDKSPLAVLLSRGQKSTDECRQIMKLIQRDSTSLVLSPSSYSAYCGTQSVINDLDKYLSEPTQTERRCELFVWNFHRADEATNHITSYSYDPTRTDKKDLSTSQLFFQALHVREYPDDEQEVIDYPFHGLVNSARTSDEFHNNQICISFRDPARDESEIQSELETLSNMGFIHFPFIVPQNDNELKTGGNTRSNTASIAHETMLQAAANQLAIQFREDQNRGTGMEHANVVSKPEVIYNPI